MDFHGCALPWVVSLWRTASVHRLTHLSVVLLLLVLLLAAGLRQALFQILCCCIECRASIENKLEDKEQVNLHQEREKGIGNLSFDLRNKHIDSKANKTISCERQFLNKIGAMVLR